MLREITPPPQMGPSGFGAGLAVAHGNIYVGSYEGVPIPPAANFGGSVNVYDAESGDYRRSFGRVLPIQGDNFGNSIGVVGPNLAVRSFLVDRNSSPDGAVHIVDATSGDVLDSIPNPQPFVIQTTTEFGDSMVGVGSRLVITNPTYAPPGGDPFAHGGVFVYENLPRMTAYSHFDEPADGAANHTRGPGQTEASFTTTTTPTGGANPLAGVETSIERRFGRSLVHRSQNATTTFQTLDLTGWHEAAVSFYLAVDATEYEAGDFLRATITNGAQTLTLVDLFGGDASAPLNLIADEQIRRYQFDIPDDWSQVSLALSSSTNSSTGAERIDFDYVLIQAVPDPAVAAFTTAVPPATADVVFDMAQGDRVRTGLNLTGPYSLGYLAHTGEADGQLRAWFEVDGLAPEELATLAIDLEFAADIVEAHVITGGPTLPTANLMLIFAAGATPGQQGAVTLNFGPSAITQAIAIPEPSTLALAAAALALFAARTRLRRQT
jgi:hypothetical protein